LLRYPQLEDALDKWHDEQRYHKYAIHAQDLQQQATAFKEKLGISEWFSEAPIGLSVRWSKLWRLTTFYGDIFGSPVRSFFVQPFKGKHPVHLSRAPSISIDILCYGNKIATIAKGLCIIYVNEKFEFFYPFPSCKRSSIFS